MAHTKKSLASTTLEQDPWAFPVIKTVLNSSTPNNPKPTKGTQAQGDAPYYGVYFYPYTKPGVDPVFAVVGGQEVIIARPNDEDGIETIRAFQDDVGFGNGAYYGACWTRDKNTGDPLLAVAGGGSIVKVLNVRMGECIQTLVGHGEEIMDLVTSPIDQSIIATTGADTAIRFWSIDPKHQKQPCSIICSGEGHRETILTIAFHATGRYLLSGGLDHCVNLWAIPENAGETAGTDKPLQIMYPHFSTAMIHSNYVDCVAFHGDFVLSRSAHENKIVLWIIQNFNSREPTPPYEKAPTTHEYRDTRSAFGGTFERVLQFSTPETHPFFLRFGLFAHPHMHPILAMGNIQGKVFLWDFTMIEDYGKGAGLGDDGDSTTSGAIPVSSGGTRPAHPKRDDISDLFGTVKPHHTLDIPRFKGTIRHIAFSLSGNYMVAVGDNGHITVCKRW